MEDIKDNVTMGIGILDSDLRKIYRNGGVSVDMAVMDSGLRETPHIADTDAWIAMDDKGREDYSATAGEIHGQASFVGNKAHCFFKIWDSVGFWIATRIAAMKARNMQRVTCSSQTFSINETDEKEGEMGIRERHSPEWLKRFESWLNRTFTNSNEGGR